MSSRSLFASIAFLGALSFVASSSLACDRHKNHQASIAEAAPVAPPVSATVEKQGVVLISPAAAAAMSASEALGSEPTAMRCPRMHKLDQALTQ
jgi:hypothetical protein